ncbi:MAG TPA: GNAT family protein [Flavipsychrobacter sp.]
MFTIRPIQERDADALYHLVETNKQRIADYFPLTLEKAASADVAKQSIQMYNLLSLKNKLHVLVMHDDAAADGLVGIIFLKNIDAKTGKCELAYFINEGHEGKGITSQMVMRAVDLAFNQLQLNKVCCRVVTDHASSNRVMQKTGFELEGVLRQEYRITDGTLKDLNYYGLLRTH